MLAEGEMDRDIMEQLNLKKTQYYAYKNRVIATSGKLFSKTSSDTLVYHKDILQERLTRLYRQAEKDLTEYAANQGGINNKDRASTYLAAQNIAINIFKLEHEGLRVLSQNGINTNRYLRRAGTEAQSERKIRILPGYTEEGGRVSALIRQEGEPGNQNKEPDQSEVY